MVHLVQLVVFSLLALVVWCLIDGLQGPAATVSRVALLVFVVFYTAFDSVAGIAVGVLVQKGHELPANDQDGASSLIEAYQDSWITGEINVLAVVGTWPGSSPSSPRRGRFARPAAGRSLSCA